MKTTRLQITMRDVEPPVTRVIDVPTASTLPELHDLLQAAIGWTDSHLHQFVAADATYGIDLPGEDVWPEDQRDEADAKLADLGSRFTYLYDFGDGWEHDVEILGSGGATPGCVDGAGSCPPEDCGGTGGYAELLAALDDPNHTEHEHLRGWVGDRLRPFDRDATDRWIHHVVGEVPDSVRLLLDLIGDGVKLTPGGRLPRALVRAMQQHRPHWYPLDQPVTFEEHLYPLAVLHDLLRAAGLLRMRHGVLAPIKAAGDDFTVVRRLRSMFDPHSFTTELTDLIIAALTLHGPCTSKELAGHVYPMLEHDWQIDGRPFTGSDVHRAISQQSGLMRGLDLVDTSDTRFWSLGPSARTLLPRGAMIAEVLSGRQ